MDNFHEEVASKRNRTWSSIAYFFCWVALVLSALIAMIGLSNLTTMLTSGQFSAVPIIMLAAFGGLAFLIWRNKEELRVEYDYTFTNGDLDVGKVFGNSRRRLMTSLSMKNVESCGAVTHQSFQRYLTMKDVKKHNWFVNRDANLTYFYFVKNNVKHMIVLEVSETMISLLRPYLGFNVWQGQAGSTGNLVR